MDRVDQESKSRRFFYTLILGLLFGYIGLKSWHVSVAVGAYQGQPLERTDGAAK